LRPSARKARFGAFGGYVNKCAHYIKSTLKHPMHYFLLHTKRAKSTRAKTVFMAEILEIGATMVIRRVPKASTLHAFLLALRRMFLSPFVLTLHPQRVANQLKGK
jgi:hypothetical protein